jgi:glycosyltransferase involved in cell wall biosynthesis
MNQHIVTFIIPSIGRKTLLNSIHSLLSQTNKNWKCIVGFDGLAEQQVEFSLPNDNRIQYVYLSKKTGILKENGGHSKAGTVRNQLLGMVQTEWTAFLDDDDSLFQDYVSLLEQETQNNTLDCCIFRMITKDGLIIPRPETNNLYIGNVGISFFCKTSFIKNSNILFESSQVEDFDFIKKINDFGGKLIVSNHITYKVNH